MTGGSKNVLNLLKENHECNGTAQEIAAKLGIGISSVTGSVNGLVKKGYAVRREESAVGPDGKTVVIKYISLTDEGMTFDPDQAEAEAAAAKEAAKAAKAAAKAAKAAEQE